MLHFHHSIITITAPLYVLKRHVSLLHSVQKNHPLLTIFLISFLELDLFNSMLMAWSPQAAMKAYLHTLQLYQNQERSTSYGSTEIIEPKCMEFISALAAGKQAKLMVEISTEGITPLTIALAVAAKQTGGKFICILADGLKKMSKTHLKYHLQDLKDVVEFVHGDNPFQLVLEYKNIDFLVIDGKLDDHLKLVKMINVNPSGCIIVGHNINGKKNGTSVPLGQVLKTKKGAGVVTLPIGEGIELTKIESSINNKTNNNNNTSGRFRRFHVTFENRRIPEPL